jgi:hypothetical protein
MFAHAVTDVLVLGMFIGVLASGFDEGGGIAVMTITMVYLLPSIGISVWLGLKLKKHFSEEDYKQLKEEYRVCCCNL